MKLKSVIASVATALATVSAFATDYYWKPDVKSGNWCDAANWTVSDGSTRYPDKNSAIAHVPKGGGYVIDLGGQTIQLSTTANPLLFDIEADGDGPLTLRNGQIKASKAYPAGDVVLDSVSFTDNYCQPTEKSHVVFQGTSPAANSELAIGAGGEKSVLCDIFGDTTCGRGQLIGGTAEGCDYPTTLTISNATLTYTSTLSNIKNCKLRFLDGGKITAAKFRMGDAATAELALKDADKETPRVSASSEATLKNMAFVVTSAETPGMYPLVRFTGSGNVTGYDGCTLDVSALGEGWTGKLEYSDKTLWAVLDYSEAGEDEPTPSHTHVWGAWTETTPASCEDVGEETRTCEAEGCDDPVATETREIKALGHDWGEWVETTPAEVGKAGVETHTCQRAGCGKTETREIPALPQEEDPEPTEAADIIATTVTDFGFVRQLKIGEDTYWVNAYTDVSKAWEFTVPEGVTAIDYLVVGGGGSGFRVGSGSSGGGGGAGGLLQGTGFAVSAKDVLTLTVGKGGVQGVNGGGRTQANSPGEEKYKGITITTGNGGDSVVKQNGVELLRAYGGAGGGAKGATIRAGGSGAGTGSGTTLYVAMPGTDGQGHDGGARESAYSSCKGATGGGGAGSPGEPLTVVGSNDGTNGGEGLPSSITGERLWYAAGGGGAAGVNTGGTHGKGGGGIGDVGGDAGEVGAPGKDGTGTGGGGSSKDNTTSSGKGGSGIIVIRYKAVAGKTSFKGAEVKLEVDSAAYDGEAKQPKLASVTFLDGTVVSADDLVLGTDYEIEPAAVGPAVGSYVVTVKGIGDSYCDSAQASFEITQAENGLTGSFTQTGWEWGTEPPAPTGDIAATFGEVVYRYYSDEGCVSPVVPNKYLEPGDYFVRAEVDETDDYKGIVSDPVRFTVAGTLFPVPQENPIPVAFGFTRKVTINEESYVVNIYTNLDQDWTFIVPQGLESVEYLAVAGGGAGGKASTTGGGGGGAGGCLAGVLPVEAGETLTLSVGAGGINANGSDTVISTNGAAFATAIGGGKGGDGKSQPGSSGGSGGGSGWQASFGAEPYAAAGTEGQGNPGGRRYNKDNTDVRTGATGGGGAGSAGEAADSVRDVQEGTNGGEGTPSAMTGELAWYAAGGGGGNFNKDSTPGAGGSGVGGDGGAANGNGEDGVDGTGSGGGGCGAKGSVAGKGGNGIIVLRYKEIVGKTSFNAAVVAFEPASYVYDGTAKPVVLKSITLVDGTVLTADQLTVGEDYVLSATEVGPDVGETLVMVTGIGDYIDSTGSKIAITPTTPVLSGTFEQAGWEWGTEPPAPTGDLTSTFGDIVYRYYSDEDCTQPFVPGKYTEAGTYYVRPEVDATANWTAVVGEPKSFTVAGTYMPVPGETTETTYGYTRELHIAGKPYVVQVFTNTDKAATFKVPSGVRTLEYLVVAGGGSGGNYAFGTSGTGGGGAGGLLEGVLSVRRGDALTVAVGKGGVKGVIGGGDEDGNGFDSVVSTNGFETVRAIGGGTGGVGKGLGRAGGSGGGSGTQGIFGKEPYAQPGIEGQGHAGGRRDGTCSNCRGGTGGGGAGSAGVPLTDPDSKDATAGGEGLQSAITGELLWYAAGGGGASTAGQSAPGGNGIGGNGGEQGTDGAACTGSGGGGSSSAKDGVGINGGNGGSGIVVLRYPTPGGLVIMVK